MKTGKTFTCCIFAVILTMAFSACNSSFKLSNNKTVLVKYRGEAADVIIPKGVKVIEEDAFYENKNLVSVTIPASVTSIGREAFYNCERLTTVTFAPRSRLMNIGEDAFSDCISLTTITIPASVTSIGDGAFSDCPNITAITIPASVTSIGDGAFEYCPNLTSITVDADNPNYSSENGILYNKAKTALIHTPEGIRGSITIPDSVTFISDIAFFNCENLTAITIPKGVTSSDILWPWVFFGCTSLAGITVDDDNPMYASHGGILYDKEKETLILAPQRISGSVTIPASVLSIQSGAFYNCTSLSRITIPESVLFIDESAFNNWKSLQTIIIQGKASQKAADTAWGESWREDCEARIIYSE